MYKHGKGVFADPWNYYDFALMCADWSATVFYFIQLKLLSSTMEFFHENKSE